MGLRRESGKLSIRNLCHKVPVYLQYANMSSSSAYRVATHLSATVTATFQLV
jgi:hypothetical protein